MKVNKDLIEKYHRQECTEEEAEAVEQWLFSAESDEALQLPVNEEKIVHKQDIWKGIQGILPEEPAPVMIRKMSFGFWSGAIAASLVTGIVILGTHQLMQSKDRSFEQMVTLNNTSSVNVRHVESQEYNVSIGTNTSARIDNITGIVDLSGSMMISPKEDITLKFEGSPEKITFKKGQTYVILKGKDGKDKIIIVSEKNLMDLPPVLQKQIINEFNI
ncbi:MAG TPA: hypothetical protein VKB19_03050 [Pedobacter sp.]|nr:hypothetical protein [Pedobacter sp.]